jgi:hypothetical protein
MTTFIKELLDIPEQVQRGDFVLRLAEGVNRADETLRDYVVTPELQACFDNALSFISSAVHSRTSKASYLHGSFGSGKSHFMAVLHLILQGNVAARSIPELAPVISKHNTWAHEKKFLLVPYHMIGAHDMESGILGGYVDFIRHTHPQAPIPGVYLAEGLFQDAQTLRVRMGDASFFATLSEGKGGTGGWGDLEAGWGATRFEAAMEEPPGSEERSQLVSALLGTFFSSYNTQVDRQSDAYLSLDKGLSVVSTHAASLGYDALILFLDELILWLASRAADLKFVHQEGQKLAKLVEAQTPDRPVPIISFVARQRDLSELIGDAVTGAQRLNFSDALKHWEGRFHTITLEDRNLPAIAEKRVLKCQSPAARAELDAAFAQTAKIREAVMNTLLTSEGDREMFRKLYPFSPALVQTLIAVSSVLQRERTALKVMMQLLVEQRDTLTVGDILPVGDLFDVIAHGDEAFSQDMAIHFDNAKRLYHQKLLPLLEKLHGRREDVARLPYDDPRQVAFRNDDRLVKTLLLAALVPGVESLRALNAERLAALNHGTIKTPIPGREGQEVLRRCRSWAASVGEIRIGEEAANPTISIQLSGVDTETIIEQARREDNQGNRIRRVRQMLFEQLAIDREHEFEQSHDFLWRQTKRSCIVLFRNIRELPDTSLDNADERWKLIIDYPFDEAGHGPRDDLSRVQAFRHTHPGGTKTLCWIPAFFSVEAEKDLGMLVILEHILTGERFAHYANHLSPQDRQAAKSLLENQRSVLRQRVQNHLDAAYGLEALTPGSLDSTHELELHERFASLQPGFEPQPPVAANLTGAMEHLLSQALEHEFPAAPHFEAEIKTSTLQKVYEQVRAATQTEDGRVAIDRPLRPLLRHIANPLQLGEMGYDATHFVLGQHWKNHFTRKAAETGRTIDVSQLRTWMDEPKPMGLPRDAENMVILLFAEQTNRSFFLHSAPFEATLTNLPDRLELREQQLPHPAQWDLAVERAGRIFGVAASPLLKASNVMALATGVKQRIASARQACQTYRQRLQDRCGTLGIDAANTDRMRTAAATLAMIERLSDGELTDVVDVLATAPVATSESAMGECVSKAAHLAERLDAMNWEICEATARLTDERKTTADEIRTIISQGLASDEHVIALAAALQEAQAKAVRLLATSKPAPEPPVIPKPVPRPGRSILRQGAEQHLTLHAAQDLLARLEHELQAGQEIHFSLSWIIEEGGPMP